MKQTEQLSLDPQNYHYIFSFQGLCYIGGAMLALAGACVRFAVKDLISKQDEKWVKKQVALEEKFDEKLTEKIGPIKEDIHFIKTCLAGRDGVSLMVLETLKKLENNYEKTNS